MTLSALWRALPDALDLFSHYDCLGCDDRCPDVRPFCDRCRAALDPALSPPPEVRVAWAFSGALVHAVHRAKFGGSPAVPARLGELLAAHTTDLHDAIDAVVPVPLGRWRLLRRGYNQAGELARAVARTLRCPIGWDAVERARETPTQTALSREARQHNVHGAFRAHPRAVRGARVLLLDDVVTTGATLAACREALLDAGASSVTCAALAHAALLASLPSDR